MKLGVVGGGTMGNGIAHVFAQFGHETVLIDATNLPKKVREITLAELGPGMVLAKGIYSPSGLLLIPEGKRLTAGIISKIKEHDFADPLTQRLMVFR